MGQNEKSKSELINSSNEFCSICLQNYQLPVKLECNHIFCFLCIKGANEKNEKRCALCRQAIRNEYFSKPNLLNQNLLEDLLNKREEAEEAYVWYYEGKNGWWRYDEQTNREIELKYNQFAEDKNLFKLVICGKLYFIDLENNLQIRVDNIHLKRKIKRDKLNIDKLKGIAGIKLHNNNDEKSESDQNDDLSEHFKNLNI